MRTIFIFTLCLPLIAADEAILIGVSDYNYHSSLELSGTSKDLEMMKDVASWLGFKKITPVHNPSLEKLKSTFQHLQKKGRFHPEDRLLLYFSGHGKRIADRNGDEKGDHLDEVLCAIDYREKDQIPIDGFITDDFIATYLKDLPCKLLVIIDSCYSGSATRSFGSDLEGDWIPKSFNSAKPMPTTKGLSLSKPKTQMDLGLDMFQKTDFITISASLDNELALSGNKGSSFTRALHAVLEKNRSKKQLSYSQLCTQTSQYIWKTFKKAEHRPVLSGHPDNFPKNIFPNNWEEQYSPDLFHNANYRLKMSLKQNAASNQVKVGQKVTLMVEQLPQDGDLNILNIDGNGQALLMYPYKGAKKDYFKNKMYLDLEIDASSGSEILLAIHSREPFNLYEYFGKPTGTVKQFSASEMREIESRLKKMARNTSYAGYGTAILEIKTVID